MIGIKDMQMPKNCADCPMYAIGYVMGCSVSGYKKFNLGNPDRPNDCPLFEVNLKVEDDEECCADSW